MLFNLKTVRILYDDKQVRQVSSSLNNAQQRSKANGRFQLSSAFKENQMWHNQKWVKLVCVKACVFVYVS